MTADSTGSGPERWPAEIAAQLTLSEKVSLLSGADSWSVPGVDRLQVPGLVTSDGPSGVRGASFVDGRSACFPCGAALAASWDPGLVEEVGRALGREARRAGVTLLLGPMINLQRHPLGGRNFESFSEDPFLTGEIAAAYLQGVQAEGVGCCVKHLVANESEFERHTISSEIAPDVLRELYLAPFERSVKAGAWAVMASYNRLNGVHSSQSRGLLTDLLRTEWGFDGVVVSDWFATGSVVEAIEAGLDLEMPGPSRFRGEQLSQAVREGRVAISTLDSAVLRVLRLIERTSQPADSEPIEAAEPRDLIRRAGARGIVLLKNDGALPLLPSQLGRVAVIGPGVLGGQIQGGGSAQVSPATTVGILDALVDRLSPAIVDYQLGCVIAGWPEVLSPPSITTTGGLPGADLAIYRRGHTGDGSLSQHVAPTFGGSWMGQVSLHQPTEDTLVRATGRVTSTETGIHTVSISATGRVRLSVDGEFLLEHQGRNPAGDAAFDLRSFAVQVPVDFTAGVTREFEVEFEPEPTPGLIRLSVALTPPDSPDLLRNALRAARDADAAIVVLQSPPGWETEGRDRPGFQLPGGQDQLVEAVARANPRTIVVLNTGGPHAMPWADAAAAIVQLWFPGQELGTSLADVLTGDVNPSGRLPMSIPHNLSEVVADRFYPGGNGVVSYGEGFELGYRRLPGSPAATPRFAFGHGLSYSRFRLGEPRVDHEVGDDGEPVFEVVVPVTNTAGPPGREVVQAYLSTGEADRPACWLVGFAGVDVEPGATGMARIRIPSAAIRVSRDGRWHQVTGAVTVHLGTSSDALTAAVVLRVPDATARRTAPGRGGEFSTSQ